MAALSRELRRQLEATIIQARRMAEEGACKALEQLAVHHYEPYSIMTREQRTLRKRLRAHGRQLGDKLDERRDTQTLDGLTQECAYEHWHRMLFARFLAESQLLIEPESGIAISLDECRELARERTTDWLQLASHFAVRMLPQIFRTDDPVLELSLPPETRQELEGLLKSLPSEVFLADDALGWVYQFWQAERKVRVNKLAKKIGADDLAAVTQLFTEDYMVLFLLHNTLGAWWAGKVLSAKPAIALTVNGEEDLRAACSVGSYKCTYLRFTREGDQGPWRPANGILESWPRVARDLKVLDPCEGSGHFLVSALPILVAIRMEEEGLSREYAVDAVLRDNLFGLELDNRCTQIAAFNLALAAWRMVGYRPLPALNIACSGLGINAREEDWVKLAREDDRVRETMRRLYRLFQQAPALGSLIDPRRVGGTLFVAEFEKVRPLLEKALADEQEDETSNELAVTAQGLLQAARILAGEFTLVATNVPYLSMRRQAPELRKLIANMYAQGKACLSTAFLQRLLQACRLGGFVALVTPQHWLFQPSYKTLRTNLLAQNQWGFVANLGAGAFETISGEVVNVSLIGIQRSPRLNRPFMLIDASHEEMPAEKADGLRTKPLSHLRQERQLANPEARVMSQAAGAGARLDSYAEAPQGVITGDLDHWQRCFWELPLLSPPWVPFLSTTSVSAAYTAREHVVDWSGADRDFIRPRHGNRAMGRRGVAVSQMSDLAVTLYTGEAYDGNVAPIVPLDQTLVAALWAFVNSEEYRPALRALDRAGKLTNGSLLKVSFDEARWRRLAAEKYGNGLPSPSTLDPTQWLFDGRPKDSYQPLLVGVARLFGYRWPRQSGSTFIDCQALGPDGLEKHVDGEGIASLSPAKGKLGAAERLRSLLAASLQDTWSGAKQAELLSQVGYEGETLEDWLRDGFFERHCELFHQRPFIWHVWDGLRTGFHALVNYHKLAAPGGEGRRTLEKLTYAYLGDWIRQQRDAQERGLEGADARVAAAEHLKSELEKILRGEPPYDIFVRWKPLHEQPIGWEPDLNDGVRMNIRPFMTATTLNGRGKSACILRVSPKIKWDKDRGKEPHRPKDQFPWFWSWDESDKPDFSGGKEFDGNRWNDLHYTLDRKHKARQRAGA
jgi:hypothetical protein